MYNGVTEGWMGVVGAVRRGVVKRGCRGHSTEKVVERVTEFRFPLWHKENGGIFSRIGGMS